MKSSIIIAIIFGLVTSMTLTLIEGNKVWIQNKVERGCFTRAAATQIHDEEGWEWDKDGIDNRGQWTHNGYYLYIPEDVKTYWLVFGVLYSTEEDKWRGPFENDGDKCWHFHGTLDNWKIYGC
ncbi:13165_t:CDS:2 [Funneliformis geosporum]|uniref:5803_t:CDS:1 n=1 Tax=Funneliformis geosporum TaxID=1117311 RepID=A0A9W4SGI5_9GLOM|nr:5803_t:CDS:2 [Funneliformis geosporum]CAI2183551.1 13165_t:CDS:2 [Funneliformis geosporum]